jgi:hypothetical protein
MARSELDQGAGMALRLCFCRLGLLGSPGDDGFHEPPHEPSLAFLLFSRAQVVRSWVLPI